MHTAALTQILNELLSAGRRGAGVELVNHKINRHPEVPFSTVTELATAAREAGVTSEDLNIAEIEASREKADGDPIRDLVADVFEGSPSEGE